MKSIILAVPRLLKAVLGDWSLEWTFGANVVRKCIQ